MSKDYNEYDDDFENQDRGDDFESDEDDEYEDDDEFEEEESEEEVSGESDEEDDEESEPRKEQRIPISRLNEVIAQREEERKRSAWLESQLEQLIKVNTQFNKSSEKQETTPSFDFDKAEEEYATLLIEGEVQKASQLRSKIERERQNELKALISSIKESVNKEVSDKSTEATLNYEFKALIENYENKYKFLDRNSRQFNEEAVDTINTLLAGYVAAGKSKIEGLKLAVNKVAPMYAKDANLSIGNQRKIDAGKKAAKAANAQPSKTKSSAATVIDATKLDVKKMSDKDFEKLTLKELKALRGD